MTDSIEFKITTTELKQYLDKEIAFLTEEAAHWDNAWRNGINRFGEKFPEHLNLRGDASIKWMDVTLRLRRTTFIREHLVEGDGTMTLDRRDLLEFFQIVDGLTDK